jgi:hypothetical protein
VHNLIGELRVTLAHGPYHRSEGIGVQGLEETGKS